jgi:hypothetical protein
MEKEQFVDLVTSNKALEVKMLLENQQELIDINGKDENGTPLLTLAVMLGHVRVVRILMEHGADPTTPVLMISLSLINERI